MTEILIVMGIRQAVSRCLVMLILTKILRHVFLVEFVALLSEIWEIIYSLMAIVWIVVKSVVEKLLHYSISYLQLLSILRKFDVVFLVGLVGVT